MTQESLAVVKFAAYVVAGFSLVVALHAIVPPVALGAITLICAAMLTLIGLTKGELPPYALVAAAMLVAFVLGLR
jgi:hypothetical protein